jgi:hypothetical protein
MLGSRFLESAAARETFLKIGSMGRKGGAIAEGITKKAGLGNAINDAARAQTLVKMGRRRAMVGAGIGGIAMMNRRRAPTGNGYQPVGSSSGGRQF